MELPETMSQPRYSWPPSTAPATREDTNVTQSLSKPINNNASTQERGSKHKRLGTRLYKKQSSSCSDLRAESDDNRDAAIGPPHCADEGAQGDGMHNQSSLKPKKVTFCKEMQGIKQLSTHHGQAKDGSNDTSHKGNQERNKDIGRYSKNPSTKADGDCSDRYLTSVNAFLKSIASDDIDLSSKEGDKLILDAIRAGMVFEMKRKETLGSNKLEVVSEKDGAVAHKVGVDDVRTGAGSTDLNVAPQCKKFQLQDSTLGGDAQREDRGSVKRDEKKRRMVNSDVCCVKNCTNTVENYKLDTRKEYDCLRNKDTTVLARGGDTSKSDSPCCELECDHDEHTCVKKATDPKCEERACGKLLDRETEAHCDAHEIGNSPVGNNQKSGKGVDALHQIKGTKGMLANDFASASATYRVELKGDHFDGKIVGKMFVVGETVQTGDNTVTEHNDEQPLQVSFSRQLLGTNLTGKLFNMKIISLVSDEEQDSQPETADVAIEVVNATGTKRSPVGRDHPGKDAVCDSPNPSACSLCLVEFTSLHHARSHYNGKAHGKRAFVSSCSKNFHCDACNITYTSRKHEEQHVRGRRHRNRVNSLVEPVPRATSPKGPTKCQADPPITGPLVCGLCSITTNSRENLLDHFNSFKHLKKIETLQKCHGKENPADDGPTSQPKQQVVANTAGSSLHTDTTLDVPTNNTQVPWRKTPVPSHRSDNSHTPPRDQPCHSTQATYVPMPITFKVPKSKFNLSNLKKMVRTVGTQFTNTNRDVFNGGEAVPLQKLPRRNKSRSESNFWQGATEYTEVGSPCSLSPPAVNTFSGKRRLAGCKAVGCRRWKNHTGTI